MEQLKHALQVGETMKAVMEYGNQMLPTPTELALHPLKPGDWVHLKTWKTGSLQGQFTPKGNGPHLVILNTHSVLK